MASIDQSFVPYPHKYTDLTLLLAEGYMYPPSHPSLEKKFSSTTHTMALGIDAINYHNNNQVSRHGHELIPWISAVPGQFLQAPANARHPDLHSTLRKPRRSGTHKEIQAPQLI